MDTVTKINLRIDELRAELVELETARRVIDRLEGQSTNGHANGKKPLFGFIEEAKPEPEGECAGKTIKECAAMIIARKNRSMHFKEIANEAVKLGYRSGRNGKSGSLAQSFWAVMRRSPDFEAVGKGRFKLVEKQE